MPDHREGYLFFIDASGDLLYNDRAKPAEMPLWRNRQTQGTSEGAHGGETAMWMLSNSVNTHLHNSGQRRAKPANAPEGVETIRQPPKPEHRQGEDIVRATTQETLRHG